MILKKKIRHRFSSGFLLPRALSGLAQASAGLLPPQGYSRQQPTARAECDPFPPFQDRGSQQCPEAHCQQGACLRPLSGQEKQRVSLQRASVRQETGKRLLKVVPQGWWPDPRLSGGVGFLFSEWRRLSCYLSGSAKDICRLLPICGNPPGVLGSLHYWEG